MKYLLLAILPFAVSCGEKRVVPGSKVNIEKYKPSLAAITKGLTTIATRRGNSYPYWKTDEVLSPEEVCEEIFQVIVKIDGNKKYVYRKTTDLLKENKVIEEIELDDSDAEKELDQLLRTSQAKIENDTLITSMVFPVESDLNDGAILSYKSTHRSRVNLLKPLCEYTQESEEIDVSVTRAGQSRGFPNASIVEVYECGEIMSDEDLKKLDLSEIKFCEESRTGEDVSVTCAVKDMSFLTADL